MSDAAPSRTFTVTPVAGQLLEIRLPFDPREVFGRARAPVRVDLPGYSYRSTVCIMRGETFVPLARVHRDAAGVIEGEPLTVTLTLDREERRVDPPADLRAALDAAGMGERWTQLSFTRKREQVAAVEGAKKPDTRARRIAQCVSGLAS